MEVWIHPHLHLSAAVSEQFRWLIGVFALGFLVPFVFADQLGMRRDLYYGLYKSPCPHSSCCGRTLLTSRCGRMLARRWVLAIALGVIFAGVMSFLVLQAGRDGAARWGATLAAALTWRGVGVRRR